MFWSKNPAPMLEYLDLFRPWHFYFQYTLNAYGADVDADSRPWSGVRGTFLRSRMPLGGQAGGLAGTTRFC